MQLFRKDLKIIFKILFFLFVMLSSGRAVTIKVEDIISQAWEKSDVQQSLVNDYVCDLHSTKVEKDSTGKVESTTQIDLKSYFKKPDKQVKKFVRASKDGKPVSEKNLKPSVFLTPILQPSEELAEQIQREMKLMLSPLLRDKFVFKILREENFGEENVWVVEALSRSKDLKLQKSVLWISQTKLRTLKIEAESIENPSPFLKVIQVTSFLSEVQTNIFLPKTTKISFDLRKVSSKHIETTNEYTHYKINTGLEDSLFREK